MRGNPVRSRCLGVAFAAFMVLAAPPAAAVDTVKLKLSSGAVIDAYLCDAASPAAKKPALIYMHGTAVREKGVHGAAAQGYDVADFCKAFAEAGYVTLVPIRETPEGSDNGDEAVEEGLATSRAAVAFLMARTSLDPARIAYVGFSEGGLIGLWAMAKVEGLAAGAIMSPATMGGRRARAERYNQMAFVRNGAAEGIAKPVFLSMATGDGRSIMNWVPRTRRALEQAGVKLTYRDTYDGDHKMFQSPRELFMKDILSFLSANMGGSP